jgi:hypothetical protein
VPDYLAPTTEEIIHELGRSELTASARAHIMMIIRFPKSELQTPISAWTIRNEANALTAYAFRHSFLEELHGGKESPLLDDPSLSRITDAEMRRLMIEASARLAVLLGLREKHPDDYRTFLAEYGRDHCERWEREAHTAPVRKGERQAN